MKAGAPAAPAEAPEAPAPWLDAPLRALLALPAPGALLVTGPAGVGKSALARLYAQALLCERRAPGQPACGRCPACGWFLQGAHPDLRHVAPDAEAHADEPGATAPDGAAEPDASGGAPAGSRASRAIRIAQIQQLNGFVAVGGHRGAQRVVIVDPADAMNLPAANALLKTLEEPPPGATFVLVTARPARLPATIRSRCRALPLAAPAPAQARAWLQACAGLSEGQADELLAVSGNAPLAARRLAGDTLFAARRALLDAIARLPDTGLAESADAMNGVDAVELVTLLQRWLTDVARVSVGAAPRFAALRAVRLAELARRTDASRLADAARHLARQRALAEHPLNARLFIEETLHGFARAFGAPDPTGYAR